MPYSGIWIRLVAAAVCCAPAVSLGQDPAKPASPEPSKPEAAQVKRKLTPQEQKGLAAKLEERMTKAAALKYKAGEITKKMGELAASGRLPTSDEAMALMKKMVEELQEIREQLQKITEEVSGIKGFIEGLNESLPVLVGDVDNLKRVPWGNYVQTQFTDTQEGPNSSGGSNRTNSDGFAMRRFRFSTTNRIDPKTSMKLSFDVAAGSQRQSADLKDAMLIYDIEPSDVEVGRRITFGQQNLGLGYELERSSSEREMPERTLYNRTMFNGERGRGVRYRHGIGNGAWIEGGLWNSLTVGDPQQTDANSFRNLNGTNLAYTAALRIAKKNWEAGVSIFSGERPGTSARIVTTWRDANGNGVPDPGEVSTVNIAATPETDRRFLYVDAEYVGLIWPQLTVRGEWMEGKDRVPTLNSNGTPVSTSENDVSGWHVVATWNLNYRNQISYRYEKFDPNLGAKDDTTIHGWTYAYWLNPGAKFSLTHERVDEEGFERKNNVWTLRVQFKI